SPFAQLTHFTITATPTLTLTLTGVGITNNSGVAQTLMTGVDGNGNFGAILVRNGASAGNMTVLINNGATPAHSFGGGVTKFLGASTAATAGITNNASEGDNSSNSDLDAGGGHTEFHDNSTAGTATISNNGGTASFSGGGFTVFLNDSSAGSATINNN